ncbi:phosphotransferase [Hamadaea tsunoensis]|uniref:phosphotransferase n=1 Tax=Hamadaea tsunoensis TaxID=53368 RepID=UPI000400C278|nr:phosphotransferase [Hamadaea tsunoensis]
MPSIPYALDAATLEHLTNAYRVDVGSGLHVSYLDAGLMNHNWRLTTPDGTRYALKQLLDVPLPEARRNLNVLAALHKSGLPTSQPLTDATGDHVVETGGHGYCLMTWIDGTHPEGTQLTVDQAHQLGRVVGQTQIALNQLDPGLGLHPPTHAPTTKNASPEQAVARAHHYITAATNSGTAFDQAIIDSLTRRIALIKRHTADQPAGQANLGPYGWTHGDLQHRNILWSDGQIAGIIDWDRIRVRSFAEEAARTATIQFATHDDIDLERVAAFATGYRTVIEIADHELADSLHRLWWKRLTDFWHLDLHYNRNDTSCDDLFFTGEHTLTWWTEHQRQLETLFTSNGSA